MKFRAGFGVAAGVVMLCRAPQPLLSAEARVAAPLPRANTTAPASATAAPNRPGPAGSPTPQSPTQYGPLSTPKRVVESSQSDRQQTRQRNEALRLTKEQLHDGRMLLARVMDMFFVALDATEYPFSTAITAATGPTAEWHQRRGWLFGGDPAALAIREVECRIKGPNWPPSCAGLQGYQTVAALPPAVGRKIHSADLLEPGACSAPSGISIAITADVSLDTMRKLATSCGLANVSQDSPGGAFAFPGFVGLHPLSRLAQSDVVAAIYVSCQEPFEPN